MISTKRLSSCGLLLQGILFLLLSFPAHAVQTLYHDLSFKTVDDKMWKDADAGLGDSFSHAILNEQFPVTTHGGFENTPVTNPLWLTWTAAMETCKLVFSESECINGVTSYTADHLLWQAELASCMVALTRSQCLNGYSVLRAGWVTWAGCMEVCTNLPGATEEWCEGDGLPRCGSEPDKWRDVPPAVRSEPSPATETLQTALGSEPPQFIDVLIGAQIRVSDGLLIGGFEGNYSLGKGSVNASYQATARIFLDPVISAGDLVTLSTQKASGNDNPSLSTDLSGIEATVGAFTRARAKMQFRAVQAGVELIDEEILNFDTGMLHQELAALKVGGGEGELEVRLFGEPIFETTSAGIGLNIPFPGVLPPPYDKFVGFPMADVALYLPDLRTPPHSAPDPVVMGRVNNSQLPVTRLGICTIGNCTESTRVDFAKIDADFDVTTVAAGASSGTPIPLGITAGIPGVAGVEVNVLDWDAGAFFGIAQDMSFAVNNISVRFDFSRALEVETASGVFELKSAHTINLGDDLVFRHPGGPLSVTPVYLLTDNTFHNQTNLILQPAQTTVYIQAKPYGTLFSGVPNWTLYQGVLPLSLEPIPIHTIFDETYPLKGFNKVTAAAIVLDPNEPPTVSLTGDAAANEGESKTFSFEVTDPDDSQTFMVAASFPDCGAGGALVDGSLVLTPSGGSFQCAFGDGPADPAVQIQVQDSRSAFSEPASLAVSVANVDPSLVAAPAAQTALPAKPIAEVAVASADVPDDVLTVSTQWQKDGGPFVDGLPSGLFLSAGADSGQWLLAGNAPSEPGVYTIRISVSDGDDGTASQDVSIRAAEIATFHVATSFSDLAQEAIEVELSCNGGAPLVQSFTISDGHPVTFVLKSFQPGKTLCEVTVTGANSAYAPQFDNGSEVSDTRCAFDALNFDNYECEILNQAKPASFTVYMEMPFAEDNAALAAQVTILCNQEITSSGAREEGGLWLLEDELAHGEWLVASVEPQSDTECWATQDIEVRGMESINDCGPTPMLAGAQAGCMFRNTLFYEGIPVLSQYGMAIMALLMLGIGFIGFRRFG